MEKLDAILTSPAEKNPEPQESQLQDKPGEVKLVLSAKERQFFHNFFVTLHDDIFQGGSEILNDVQIHCSDGIFRAPSGLLACISPLFKAVAPAADIFESPSLILPQIKSAELKSFIQDACFGFESFDLDSTKHGLYQDILDVLCAPFKGSDDPVDLFLGLDQDWTTDMNKENEPVQPRRKGGRRKGQKNAVHEPYVKIEVTDSHRVSDHYGLRTTVKRKRFTDEVSEPSDLDDLDEDLDLEQDSSADEFIPEEYEQNAIEEESETDEDLEDVEEELEEALEDDLLESDEEVIDMAKDDVKRFKILPRGLETFTVKKDADGNLEAIAAFNDEPSSKAKGRPRKKVKLESNDELVAIGKVVPILEDEDLSSLSFKSKKIYASVKSNPRSLLKSDPEGKPVPLILFCSQCEEQFSSQAQLKHHAAKNHKGSKFFILPKSNPHRNCSQCSSLMKSYESMLEHQDPETFSQKNVCFPCPHCRRRYIGHLGGLTNHLINDHRNAVQASLNGKPEDYYQVLDRSDAKVLVCDFCDKSMPNVTALNKHLIGCPSNNSGISAGLFCHICGKMFAQSKYLKDHLNRHGRDQVNKARNFCCKFCPVTCITEANLEKHLQREHSSSDPDDSFVLHENCQRCSAMFQSYLANKVTNQIPFREMVFKCPHCCMILYANPKHAPRYLHNHINKFHTDPEINDFSLGLKNDPKEFRLRSKKEASVLTCEFCGFASKNRANHNVHLSTCKQSTVPCRPGYMCDTCGFIAGTAVHLRNHLETHNDPRTFACSHCSYSGRSKRYLLSHLKNHHTAEGLRKRAENPLVACPQCGKLKRSGPSYRAHVKKCGTGPGKVHCPHCSMEFKRSEDMKAHVLIHNGVITCPVHNILFQHESEVYQHVNKAEPHDKFPKLECCNCGKSFKHMCLFMKHLRKELNILPYRCNLCGKHVNTYASLQLHVKRMHQGEKVGPKEKNFKCDHCDKCFGTRGHLNEHINGVHNQGAAMACPICQKIFNTAKRMKKHLFNAHKESAEEFRNAWKHDPPFANITIQIQE